MCELDLEEAILANKDDVVILLWVKFMSGIRRDNGVSICMETGQSQLSKTRSMRRRTKTYSHLYEDMQRGAPRTFSGSNCSL